MATEDGIIEALTGGAPCAQTLTTLCLDGDWVSSARVATFCQALVKGNFPKLTKLELGGHHLGRGFVRDVAQALLAMHAQGTPARLTMLALIDRSLGVDALDELTPLFAAGAVPSLISLEIQARGKADIADFVQAWLALGPKIKLQTIKLQTLSFQPAIPEGPCQPRLLPLSSPPRAGMDA